MNPWFKISDKCYVDLTQIALVQEVDYMTIHITLKNGIQKTIETPKFASSTINKMKWAMKKLYEVNLPSFDGTEECWKERYNGDSC